MGCPGQFTRTTIIPHDPLDILQAQEQVRHLGGNRHAHRGSNPGGDGTSPRWTTAARPSSTEYTRELEPGHLGRAKPAKATARVKTYNFIIIGTCYTIVMCSNEAQFF